MHFSSPKRISKNLPLPTTVVLVHAHISRECLVMVRASAVRLNQNMQASLSQKKKDHISWHDWSDKARQSLELGDSKPWTGRSTIACRGFSKQGDEFNFLHELLDLRWATVCLWRNISASVEIPPVDVWTDGRHCLGRQIKSGSMVLLGNSQAYWYYADRTACPLELLRHQGWHSGLDIASIGNPVPGMEGCPLNVYDMDPEGGDKKRCKPNRRTRTRRANAGNKACDLAGNMVCIPDFAAVWYSAALASSDKFQNPCPTYQQACALLGVREGNHVDEAVILNSDADNIPDVDNVEDISSDDDEVIEDDVRAFDPAESITFEEIFSD